MANKDSNRKPGRLKALLAHGLEGAAILLLVLVFFSVFLVIMNFLFPTGSSIKDIVGHEEKKTAPVPASEKIAALLTDVHNTVKSKGANSIAWSNAREGMPLYDRYAVQTLQQSSASLVFDKQSSLEIGANTLLIVRSLERNVQNQEKRSLLLMVDGGVHGQIVGSGRDSLHLEITTPNATVRFETGRFNANKTDFNVTINPDKSSTVTVFGGEAHISAGEKEVLVESNKSITIGPGSDMDGPKDLPGTVALIAPVPSGKFLYRDLSPRINFRWKAVPEATSYHFVLARDSLFRDIVMDERITQTEFTYGKLPHSTYYWRVSALEQWREGLFSDTGQFDVVQKLDPPKLFVNFPPENVKEKRCTISGNVEPGVRVFIMGKRVETDQAGNFEYTVELAKSINVLVVEAVDAAGNVSYQSRLVQGAY
jgi:hypothetical protein